MDNIFDSIIPVISSQPIQNTDKIFKFDEKENARIISLDDLRFTRTLKNYKVRLPATRPMEHTQFIDTINAMLDGESIVKGTPEIFVSRSDSNYDDRVAAAYNIPYTLSAWFFNRLVCRIPLMPDGVGDYNPNIAIGYNDKGITLAYGVNVRICSNMSIFGGKLLKTYDKGLPFSRMLELFGAWLKDAQELYHNDLAIMQRMKTTYLEDTRSELQKMIGRLHLAATARNMGNKEILAPLDQTQVNAFSNQILTAVGAGDINLDNPDNLNVYDLYNIGTNILTHSQSNLEYKWERISAMGQFMEENYLSEN
jgi:hypothetical protein